MNPLESGGGLSPGHRTRGSLPESSPAAGAPAARFLADCTALIQRLEAELSHGNRHAGRCRMPTTDPRSLAFAQLLGLILPRFVAQPGQPGQHDNTAVRGLLPRLLPPPPSPALVQEISRYLDGYRFTPLELASVEHGADPADRASKSNPSESRSRLVPAGEGAGAPVDPQMLATLEENLHRMRADHAADARGVFYTPRPEIDLMCRLALFEWLAGLPSEGCGARSDAIRDRSGPRHDSRDLLRKLVFARDARARAVAKGAAQRAGKWQAIEAALSRVAVLDPACGAGSFLLGMFRLLRELRGEEHGPEIGRHNLFGMDVSESALLVARVRLHLAAHGHAAAAGSARLSAHAPAHAPAGACIPGGALLCLASSDAQLLCGDSLIHRWGRSFDIVIGNPPYVRQQTLSDPCPSSDREPGRAGKQSYRDLLARAIACAFPDYFDGQERLSGKSDLYLYFILLGLGLLAPHGMLCFLTSNAWLDAAYGAVLRDFLARRGHLRMLLDHRDQRSFAAAQVNTAIALLSAGQPPATHPPTGGQGAAWRPAAACLASGPPALARRRLVARFVSLRIPFEQACSEELFLAIDAVRGGGHLETAAARVRAVALSDLGGQPGTGVRIAFRKQAANPTALGLGGGVKSAAVPPTRGRIAQSVIDRWGGPLLRAPEIYFRLLERGAGRLEPLAASCLVEGYVHDNTTGPSFPAARLVRSLRDVDRILLEGSAPGIRASGVAVTPSSRRVAPLWFARTFGSRHLVVWNRAGVLGKEFYRLFPPEAARTISLAAQLNGTLTILQREILGLANLGDGALKFSTDEIRRILWLPELPSAVLAPLFLPLAGRVMGTLPAELDQPDRRKMDALIFDALGLNPKEQAAVYQGVRELVGTRLRKAASRGR